MAKTYYCDFPNGQRVHVHRISDVAEYAREFGTPVRVVDWSKKLNGYTAPRYYDFVNDKLRLVPPPAPPLPEGDITIALADWQTVYSFVKSCIGDEWVRSLYSNKHHCHQCGLERFDHHPRCIWMMVHKYGKGGK